MGALRARRGSCPDEERCRDRRAAHPGEVEIGAQVTIEDIETGEQKSFVVGSYQVLDQQHDNEISYAAPLAKPVMGATVGEEREVTIGDRTTLFRVVGIE